MCKKCKVLECSNNAVKGSDFCEEHKTFIISYCSGCGAKIKLKSRNYEPDGKFYCRSCSSKMRIIEYNKSEASTQVRHMNMVRYNNSEAGKKNREKGLKAIHSSYTGSPKHIQQIRALGLRTVQNKKNKDSNSEGGLLTS